MKKPIRYTWILLLFSLLLGCREDFQSMAFVCDCQQKKQVLNFLTTNLQAANNMSDEEMEDVISELTKTAVAMNCQQRLVWFDYDRNVNLKKEQLDSCQSIFSVKYEKLDLN